jgi:hypothetical protein
MLRRHLGAEDRQQTLWQELSEGTATIVGFATLCSMAMCGTAPPPEELSEEAKAILAAAVGRGIMDIRGSKESFDSSERLLGVCVEQGEDSLLLFRRKSEPEQTIRFLDGFRQLCQAGLVMHHMQREFSLTTRGYEAARKLDRSELEELLEFALEVPH